MSAVLFVTGVLHMASCFVLDPAITQLSQFTGPASGGYVITIYGLCLDVNIVLINQDWPRRCPLWPRSECLPQRCAAHAKCSCHYDLNSGWFGRLLRELIYAGRR